MTRAAGPSAPRLIFKPDDNRSVVLASALLARLRLAWALRDVVLFTADNMDGLQMSFVTESGETRVATQRWGGLLRTDDRRGSLFRGPPGEQYTAGQPQTSCGYHIGTDFRFRRQSRRPAFNLRRQFTPSRRGRRRFDGLGRIGRDTIGGDLRTPRCGGRTMRR